MHPLGEMERKCVLLYDVWQYHSHLINCLRRNAIHFLIVLTTWAKVTFSVRRIDGLCILRLHLEIDLYGIYKTSSQTKWKAKTKTKFVIIRLLPIEETVNIDAWPDALLPRVSNNISPWVAYPVYSCARGGSRFNLSAF